jgi:VCBS repeat-containing protein
VGTPDPGTGAVTGNAVFTDPAGRTLSYSGLAAGGGTVAVNATTGAFTYTPSQAQQDTATATTTFAVTANNGVHFTSETVTVPVDPGTPQPGTPTVATPDPSTGAVTGNAVFTGVAGRTLTYTGPAANTSAGGGAVTVNSDGSFTYTPTTVQRQAATATTTDTFTVTANNGVHTAPETVTVPVLSLDGAAVLKDAESVIGSALDARAAAQADLGTYLTSLGTTLSGAQLDVLVAQITADAAATQSMDTQTAAAGTAAIRTKLGQDVTDTDIATIVAKAAAIRTAETSLTTPITVAADARALAAATAAATGAPVFSRVEDLVVGPTGIATGTLVFIDPQNDPLVYSNVGGVFGDPAPGVIGINVLTGAFLYGPDPLLGGSPTSVTFLVFVTDGKHLVAQTVTIDLTPTAVKTLADAEAAEVALNKAINDRPDALKADPTAISAQEAQIEAVLAAAAAKANEISTAKLSV